MSILISKPSAGAIKQSVSAQNVAAGGTLSSGNLGSSTVSGNFLLVMVSSDDTTATCADSLGNTFTERGTCIDGSLLTRLRWFTAPITTGGASNAVTATYGVSIGNRFIVVLEIPGVSSWNVGDTLTDVGSNPTPNPALSATNSSQPAFAVAFVHQLQGFAESVGSGYTLYSTFITPDGTPGALAQYKAITSVAAQTAQFVNPDVDRINSCLAIFIDAAAVAAAPGALMMAPTQRMI